MLVKLYRVVTLVSGVGSPTSQCLSAIPELKGLEPDDYKNSQQWPNFHYGFSVLKST